MVREVSDHNATQEEMDNNQYLKNGILRYQRVFGYTYVSTGGKQTTEVCRKFKKVVQRNLNKNFLNFCYLVYEF